MRFKNPFQSATAKLLSSENENQLYAKAAEDISEGIIEKGLWTKAFISAEGDEQKQKAHYLELIVSHYKDLIEAGREIEDILNAAKKKEIREEEKKKKAKEKANYYKHKSYRYKQAKLKVNSSLKKTKVSSSEDDLRYIVNVPKHTSEETRDVMTALFSIIFIITFIFFIAA